MTTARPDLGGAENERRISTISMRRLRNITRNMMGLLAAVFVAGAAAAEEPLVLGSYAYPGLDREQALAPLANLVETTLGQAVQIRLYKDPDAIAAAVIAGEVDVAVLNLGAWLRAATAPDVLPLVTPDVPLEAQDRYRAVLLARPTLGLTDLVQVNAAAPQLRLAMVLRGSTSGGIVQLAALAEQANDTLRWASVDYVGSHEAALSAVLQDRADIATIADAPWRKWLAANSGSASMPKEIWRSEPLPPGPVVCRKSDRVDCSSIAAALMGNTSHAGKAAEAIGAGWPELAGTRQFIAYEPARYAGLIAAGSAGI